MRANPGGEVSPNDVIGRDTLIQDLWRTLERQSVVLVAERRVGKSTVIKKMRSSPPKGVFAVYRDVENLATPLEFIERLYQDVEPQLSTTTRATSKVKSFLKEVAGFELGGVVKFPPSTREHWKELLESVFDDLCRAGDQRIVLFWDELPLFIHKVKQAEGERLAMDVMDSLRSLRQTHQNLRMVFTGSIGLHHVVTSLREAGHANDATNDMKTVEVSALADCDAVDLAKKLLIGESIECEDGETTAGAIAKSVDQLPFYIQSIVSEMVSIQGKINASTVTGIVQDALVDDQDRWHLQHFYDRIPEYYGSDRVPIVHAILDELAVTAGSLALAELIDRLKVSLAPDSSNYAGSILGGNSTPVIDLLRLLRRDHYVTQNSEDGSFQFRGTVLKRWWKLFRGLS